MENKPLHLSKSFNRDLAALVNQLLHLGGLVEQQLELAVEALLTSNSQAAQEAQKLENQIDDLDLLLGEACAQILVLRQPAASDLRMTLAINRCVSDLERMGDEAYKIACMALTLEEPTPVGYVEIRHISQEVASMLHDVLHAFSRQDVALALEVKARDRQVDLEYSSAMRALITFMMEEPRTIGKVLNIIWVLRALERIGDHACNLAEQVVYMVQGQDIRHASQAEVDKLLSQFTANKNSNEH